MDSEKEFQEKMRKLGTLVGELDQMPGGGSKVATRELVLLLMEVHRTGLERIMELVFDSGNVHTGAGAINRLGQDPIVRNLLLLYSLHPDDLETRVLQALEAVKGRLRKVDREVKLVSIQDGTVQLQVQSSRHAHGSKTKTRAKASDLRSIIEGSVYDLAPDVASLTILGLEEESSGFVPLDALFAGRS